MNEVKLVAAQPSDYALIEQLAIQIWNVHYPPIIGQEQVDYMLGKMYNYDALVQQSKDGQQFLLAYLDEVVIGFISVSTKNANELFIHKFYILDKVQAKGIGTKAFHALISMFADKTEARLTVNRQNYKSINFYFKNKFVIERVADFDIGDGYVMNDFVMLWRRNN